MTTIVMNTLTGAVSQYAAQPFDSLTATHAGGEGGLYLIGGDTDGGVPIVATVTTAKKQWGSSLKKYVDMLFFAVRDGGSGVARVFGEKTEYRYNLTVGKGGEARSKPGRGIRENYLAFGFQNPSGESFKLDRIEVMIGQSETRRS